jgi:ribosomal protein S18 acetylase RimI-like enzyme
MVMLDVVRSAEQIKQIHALNQLNLKQNLPGEEREKEGFVSWLYSIELLEQMNELSPGIVASDGDKIVGYALTTLKEARSFHKDLETMFLHLDPVPYLGKPLSEHHFYCMGQICVDKDYRGKGLVRLLYEKHKAEYGQRFDFILTEISINNPRSQKAHEKVGFRTIHSYKDGMDEWNVVVWDWK